MATTLGTKLGTMLGTELADMADPGRLFYGLRGWSAANFLSSPVGGGIAATAVSAYWVAIAYIATAKAGSAFQVFANKSTANGFSGYNLYTAGTNGTLVFTHGSGIGTVQGGSYVITNASVGKVSLAFAQWTGTALQFFADRQKRGSDVAAAAYTPYAGAFTLGRHADTTGNPASDNLTMLGFMGGSNIFLSLAEVEAASDAFAAQRDLVAVPGKTDRLWSAKRASASAGTVQPWVDALGSGETLSINGAPTLSIVSNGYVNW